VRFFLGRRRRSDLNGNDDDTTAECRRHFGDHGLGARRRTVDDFHR